MTDRNKIIIIPTEQLLTRIYRWVSPINKYIDSAAVDLTSVTHKTHPMLHVTVMETEKSTGSPVFETN